MDVVPLIDVVYQLPMNFDEPLQMNTSIVIQKSNFFVTPPPSHRLPPLTPHRTPPHKMSFAVTSSATRVVVSARAPVKARNTTVAAFAAPVASKATAAKLSSKSAVGVAGLKATRATTAAKARGNMSVFAGRFKAERTYIMIKPDGVQRGYVRIEIDTTTERCQSRPNRKRRHVFRDVIDGLIDLSRHHLCLHLTDPNPNPKLKPA